MGLSSPSCTSTGTVALHALAELAQRWSRMGFSPDTQAWAGSLQKLSWVLPPHLPCPHTILTLAVPGLTGCLHRQSLQAEPPGGPQQDEVPPPHQEGGTGEPRAKPQLPPAPPTLQN